VTPQKLEILKAVADGKNYRDIASIRGTTEQVVKNQMVRILRELQAENRVTAVATAIRPPVLEHRVDGCYGLTAAIHEQGDGGQRRVGIHSVGTTRFGFQRANATLTGRHESSPPPCHAPQGKTDSTYKLRLADTAVLALELAL
jgi:DNA-binding CsgD family transcriptional regulator